MTERELIGAKLGSERLAAALLDSEGETRCRVIASGVLAALPLSLDELLAFLTLELGVVPGSVPTVQELRWLVLLIPSVPPSGLSDPRAA